MNHTKDSIELIFADGYNKCCYPVLTDFMIDYKEQVFITGIKVNMECLTYYILPKERELVI